MSKDKKDGQFLGGKISDRVRGDLDGKVDINPGRPDMEKVKNDTPHEGHRFSNPNRRVV